MAGSGAYSLIIIVNFCLCLPFANRQPERVDSLPEPWDQCDSPEYHTYAGGEYVAGEPYKVLVPEAFDAEQRNLLHQAKNPIAKHHPNLTRYKGTL